MTARRRAPIEMLIADLHRQVSPDRRDVCHRLAVAGLLKNPPDPEIRDRTLAALFIPESWRIFSCGCTPHATAQALSIGGGEDSRLPTDQGCRTYRRESQNTRCLAISLGGRASSKLSIDLLLVPHLALLDQLLLCAGRMHCLTELEKAWNNAKARRQKAKLVEQSTERKALIVVAHEDFRQASKLGCKRGMPPVYRI